MLPRDPKSSVELSLSRLDQDAPDSAASLLGFPIDSPRFVAHRFVPKRRRLFIAAGSVLSALSLFVLAYFSLSESSTPPPILVDTAPAWNRKAPLLGPPTDRFRDNLRNDTKYITSWISAGWTNDVMTYGNLIYLAMITERVPIIGPFTPSHIGGDAGIIPFGEVFDVDYLSKAIGMPVLEWSEVKNTSSQEVEDIGCWSVWQGVQTRESDHDSQTHEQVACFDYLYYVCAHTSFEYEHDISPAWRFVVKNFRWTNQLQTISDGYMRRIFGITEEEPIPPYIAIHARRANDFIVYCNGVPKDDCFPSIPTYQRRIAEIQEEVRERHGYVPQHVIMLSDEEDPAWWDSIRMMGWYTTDHVTEDTVNKYGRWYPLLIDAVIQSSGVGMIGMQGSTMSLLAGRRVQDWQQGVFKNIKWGTPTADDH
ncbi:hypothetical protein BC834DRAFT_850667 [Gloeopeniophorella convolvens]|nr:hypothetical protein BC834DRAFT_850667 [Gloeopeniophorella convolvens]